jgi:hypothetical protein
MENLSHHLWYNSVTETWRNDLFYRSQFISWMLHSFAFWQCVYK